MASDRGHINQALTNYVVGIAKNMGGSLIADQVAPPVGVPNMSDRYWILGDDEMRIDSDIIALSGDVPRVSFTESDSNFNCLEYGQETVLKKALLANADSAVRYQQRRAAGLITKVQLALEARVAAKYADTGTLTQTSALAAADRWDADTSDPVGQAMTAKETVRAAIGAEPNTLIVGPHVAAHLRLHPAITSRLAGLVAGTPATDAQIASVLGVDRYLVGKASKITSLEGASKTRGDVWGKIAVFAYIEPNPSGMVEGTITPFQRFRYTGFMPEFGTYEYEEGALKRILGVYACYDLATVAASAAYLYTTVVG
jgi:hypothetical protein